ncbi:MAG: response regulator [Alphaproteobacteria bacterium]|nr:response regulator [Alphaproteobacteria bacterium]NCQ66237.1 response regulator [Alphaproteobacteria bacterium]NCT06585.1 response regulator [Alphaproteobacteria bacterium]
MAVNKDMSILVVDDFNTMRRIVRSLLKQLGFNNVDEAVDGNDALSKISAKEYALVLSDWNMEPKSGIDLLREVRQSEKHKNMPFILITAESKIENIVEAKKASVNQYIVKPFNAKTLKEKLSTVIGDF